MKFYKERSLKLTKIALISKDGEVETVWAFATRNKNEYVIDNDPYTGGLQWKDVVITKGKYGSYPKWEEAKAA